MEVCGINSYDFHFQKRAPDINIPTIFQNYSVNCKNENLIDISSKLKHYFNTETKIDQN